MSGPPSSRTLRARSSRPAAGAPVDFEYSLPAAIGTTSFRVKGHVYQKMKEDIAQSLSGGVDELVAHLESEEVKEFAKQPFIGGAWYDALPVGPMSYTHARLVGKPLHFFARERGRTIANHDVPGIYKALLRLFSPSTLISRLPRVATMYFDFGKTTVEQLAAGRARVVLAGLPFTLAPTLAGVIEGFVSVALEQSGAKNVVVRTIDVTYDGAVVDGVPTTLVRHEAFWG